MIDDLKIDIEKFDKIVKAIKSTEMKEVSFEFLVGSCFPKAMKNIKEELHRQHALGFAEGIKAKEQDE